MTALSPEVLAKYQPVIGLEVHVQLLTESKAFCGCINRYGGDPNTHVCSTCLGLPGALPVLNRRAVELAVLAAKAIHCDIRETSIFSRKNYFYPDSPKGYQISQFDQPLAEHGWIDVPDASGAAKFGTKAEVKNVNSFRYIRAALEYEIERQIDVLETGNRVVQESRLWNNAEGRTYSMRSKEQAHDYRYFPEPDLPPLVVGEAWQREILTALPELPEARRARMIAQYDINPQDAMTLTATRAFADSFEAAAKAAKSPKRVVSLITSELTGRLKAAGLELEQSPVSLKGIVQAADLAESGDLSSKMLKQLLDACFAEGKDFTEVYERDKPRQISDAGAIEAMIDEVIAASPKQVAQYLGGKKTVAAFFVGNVMRLSKGQANPALLNELVTRKLDSLGSSS